MAWSKPKTSLVLSLPGALTQLVECLLCKQDVGSSILPGSTKQTRQIGGRADVGPVQIVPLGAAGSRPAILIATPLSDWLDL